MPSPKIRFDLLARTPLRVLVRSPLFPLGPQLMLLIALVALVWNGFGLGTDMSPAALTTFRKTNLTTLIVWGLWWPGMIAVALVFGRAWCTACPLELVNRIGDAVARRVGWPRARLGRVLRVGWLAVALYLALQLLVAGASLHRIPHYTALLLLALLGGALFTGLVFRRSRSFCQAFCPAGALLSVYGRYTAVQLDTRDTAVCDACTTRDCVGPANRYRFDKRSCPSLLRPYERKSSDGCVLCLQCAKVCPHDNVGLGIIRDDTPVRRKSLLEPHEAAFVLVALGFVSHEVVGEVRWLDNVFHRIPQQLATLAPVVPFSWFEALWFLFLFPVVVWGVIAGIGRLAGHRGGRRLLLLAVATGAAPIVAAAHLAKAVAKISSWGGFVPLALRDPQGVASWRGLADGTLGRPSSLLGLSVMGWVMLALLGLLVWRSLYWSRELPSEATAAVKAGLVGSAVLFCGILFTWAWPHF